MKALTRGVALGLLALLAWAPALPARAQERTLTLADLYDPVSRVDFTGSPVSGLQWIDDAHYAWPRPAADGADWLRVDAATGETVPLYDADAMQAALAAVPGLSDDEARRLSRSRGLRFTPGWTGALVDADGDLYYYDFGGRARRLTDTDAEEQLPRFSPDGRRLAYVREGNLFVTDLATGSERALTTDGSPVRQNGRLDWVYEEELYGRGNRLGYWWSPDSTRVAFLQIDDTAVPEFTVVDEVPYHLDVETWAYPKAGDANPVARLGMVSAAGGAVTWVDTSAYAAIDFLIVNVAWTPDSGRLFYQVQDREQRWLELEAADRATGRSVQVLRETSPTWVNCGNLGCQDDDGNPVWLADGSFLWASERTGWRHLYLYGPDGSFVRPLTSGVWEARVVHGIDEEGGWIYFSGTERSPIGLDVYRVRLDGTGLERLSRRDGTHSATFSPAYAFYLDRWSDARTPPQTRLHHADGREARVVDENPVPALAEFRLPEPEFLQVETRDGFDMEAMMIKPLDFDPTRKYPVYQYVYGGPHIQRVLNAWIGENMFHRLLASQGVIVWICDNRTASGKGVQSTWPVFRRFGESELRDIEDGLQWLTSQPYVDADRIGIHGWSYGGFLTSYALTHSTRFAMGIAGGTVSDWRDYDTIYTERYLQTPEHNPDGYRASSPRFFAGQLHGRLMLIHGTVDDNVHMQNTLQLAYALQQAGQPFDLMLYPRNRHSITDPQQAYHMRSMMYAFIRKHLLEGADP